MFFSKKNKKASERNNVFPEYRQKYIIDPGLEKYDEIFSSARRGGVRWEMHLDGTTRVIYLFGNHFCFGSQEIEGPSILAGSTNPFYLSVGYSEVTDSYMVISDYEGPFREYPPGKVFDFETDVFTLL